MQGQGSVVAGRQFASPVWFAGAMGLLDDAIREHLELKRLRGADPVEVAREEHEALDPVPRDERASPDLDLEGVEEQPGGAPEAAGDLESSDDLRETAELDMRTLLDEDQRPPDAPAPSGSTHDEPEAPDEEDSLEWEFPGDSATRAAAHRGDLEHGSGRGDPAGTIGEGVVAADRGEDALKGPRDPLPEPPEQERLRFDERVSGE